MHPLINTNKKHFDDYKLAEEIDHSYFVFDLPEDYKNLLNSPKKKKARKGGRGGIKSSFGVVFFTQSSFFNSYKDKLVLNFRQFQTSINDSAKRLYEKAIKTGFIYNYNKTNLIPLSYFFIIKDREIINKHTNAKFLFLGLNVFANVDVFRKEAQLSKIKGKTNVGGVWVDEAAYLNEEIMNVLMPTAREHHFALTIENENNEIVDEEVDYYFSWNPIAEVDYIDKYLANRDDVDIRHINIFDIEEKFQNKKLLKEAEQDKINNPESYPNIWLGAPSPLLTGQPFKNLITINEMPKYNPKVPICAWLDPSFLGGDYTALSIIYFSYTNDVIIYGRIFKKAWIECLDEIAELIKQFHVNETGLFYYENNGLGNTPEYAFRREKNLFCQGIHTKNNKINDIYSMAHFVKYMRFIFNKDTEPYVKQIKSYEQAQSINGHDDAPDSLARLFLHEKLENWLILN